MKPRHTVALALPWTIITIFLAVPLSGLCLFWFIPLGKYSGLFLAVLYVPDIIPNVILTLFPHNWMSEDQYKLLTIIVMSAFPVVAWTLTGVFVAKRIGAKRDSVPAN